MEYSISFKQIIKQDKARFCLSMSPKLCNFAEILRAVSDVTHK